MAEDSGSTPQASSAPVIRSAGITLVGSVVGGLMVIVGELLAARLLQGRAYGLYASGITVARIGEAIAMYGLPVGIFHYLPTYRQKSQTDLVVGTIYAAAFLPIPIGGAFAAAIWIAAPWLAEHVFNSAPAVIYLRLLSISVPFMACAKVFGAITRGFGDTKYYVIVNNLIPPGAFLVGLGLMARYGADPVWITAVVVAANLLGFAAGVLAVVRVAGSDLWRVKPAFRVGALYRYSSEIMVNTFFYMLFAWTGILTVGVFLGSDSVGIYRMCLQVIVPFEMIVLAFNAAMGPIYPVLTGDDKRQELQSAYSTAVRWMVMLHLPIGMVLAWNGHDLLALLGPQFVAGSAAVVILAIGFAASSCFATGAYLLMLSGRKSVETKNAAFTTALNVALTILLVPRMGITGAAVATTGSYFILNVARVWEVRRLAGLRTIEHHFVRVVAVGAGTGLGAFVVLKMIGLWQEPALVSIVLRVTVMLVMYAAFLWAIGLNRTDKETVRALVRSAVRA